MGKQLNLGLDIGTDSVGWALLDENNQIIKKNGFAFWGVRMFDEAKDAKDRRSFRCSRRRLNRRHHRIELLRGLFSDEINKVDSHFFERLDDSFYKQEDKRNFNTYNLFNGSYTDKDFYNKYPTIFHLRNHLAFSDEKADIREIYLAIHHIIKYRGNFLTNGDSISLDDVSEISNIISSLNNILLSMDDEFSNDEDYVESYFTTIENDDNLVDGIRRIILSKKSKNEKKKELQELFNVPSKSLVFELYIPLLIGSIVDVSSKVSLVKSKKYESMKLDFSLENFEELCTNASSTLVELSDALEFLREYKKIYDHFYLERILKDSSSISGAMIKIYDNHCKDLKLFKKIIKTCLPEEYNNCFRKIDEKLFNYPKYIGMNDSSGKRERFSHCNRENFYKYVSSLLAKITDEKYSSDIENIKTEMENGEFLQRLNSSSNGAIPMQLHLNELKNIIEKQSKYYSFLNELDENGVSCKEKIISVFKFTIPYYVGPLNAESKYSWVQRSNEKIYPWNFEKVVDVNQSAIQFIERMQNKCTYLKGENDYCLPKNSILFSEYNCLSYLNKIQINGTLLNYDTKMKVFENVFLKTKKPNKKMIIDYLISLYGSDSIKTSQGKDLPNVNCDMSSYIIFKDIFGADFEKSIDMIEQIIKDVTIFEDKKILSSRLKDIYNLDSNKIKRICELNYKAYGRLSKKVLSGLTTVNNTTGEIVTIIEAMRNTNMNLQELLYHPDYRFIDRIDEYNADLIEDNITLNDYIDDNISISPNMKRPLIQAYNIITEIEKIFNKKIDNYYVECTRSNKADKKPSSSRYNNIKELYKYCDNIANEMNVNMKELNHRLDESQDKLRSDSIFLYFMQLGKCMYTLEDIDFGRLSELYDIDHIYPQAIIKDDSLSNRVLTKKSINHLKSDNALFEISNVLPKERYDFYAKLLDLGFISKEKYRRLTQKEICESDLEGFVNRQLVVTNQATKGLIDLLKGYCGIEPSRIIFSKAENVSDFRHKFGLVKSRLANNYHHAHDAYLNVIVGKTLNDYFNRSGFYRFNDYYRLKNEGKTINPEKIFERDSVVVNGVEIWNKSIIPSIKKDLYSRYDISETVRTNYSTAMYSKTTILPAGTSDSSVPVKENSPLKDTSKYGGITSCSFSKYVLLKEINKKGLTDYYLEAIPKNSENKIEEYLKNVGYNNFNIVNNNIKTNVVVIDNKKKYCITGKTSNAYCIKNLFDKNFNYELYFIIYKLDKFIDVKKRGINILFENNKAIISPSKVGNAIIEIDYEEVIKLCMELSNMFKKEIFNYGAVCSIPNNIEYYINNISLAETINLCIELLNLIRTNARISADLKMIGLSQNSGIITINKKLKSGLKFVSESITGYYSKVIGVTE